MQTKSGKSLHPIGIGTWMVGGTFEADPTAFYGGAQPSYANETREIEAIQYSLSKGQNHIDCAELYGAFHTDEIVGKAIAGADREDLFIADKPWKTSVGAGKLRPSIEQMLQKLGTDYLDLLYIHEPWEDAPWREALPQIDELINEGIVRSFGVSNFTTSQMQETMDIIRHPIVANQVKYNVLYKDEADYEFRAFCKRHDIQIVAYQPIKRQAVFQSNTIIKIAEAHNATAAQVALAWLLAKQALPIPKAVSHQHIDENVGAVEIALTSDEIARLDKI